MENSDSLGVFIARADAPESSFPEANASGLWQAWRMPDGHYIVQALNEHMQPQGNLAMMSAENFVFSLAPLPSDEEITAAGRRFLQADAPDLLDIWYERLMAEKDGGGTTAPANAALADVPPDAGSGEDVSGEDVSGVVSGLAHKDGPDAGPSALPPLFSGPAPAPASSKHAPDYCADDAFYENRRAMLESSMRAEFFSLIEQMDESPYPALEAEMEKLLLRGGGFSWKQKFMFSEFGMALRRKGKASLALLAHERALNLAPGDGHILFNLARSEYELGNMPAVRSYLEQALEVLPDFAPARNFLAFLEGGQSPVKAKDSAAPQ